MKRIFTLLLTLAMLCALAACGGGDAPARSTPAPSETPVSPADENAALRAHARAALETLLRENTLPDGTQVLPEPAAEEPGNRFALFDADGDGADELVILYAAGPTAGQIGAVYALGADGTWRAELTEYVDLTFFENGAVKAGWSHNQGLGGSFWPYTLYRYDAAADSYALLASVDAWDRTLAETNAAGEAFPAEADVSGTGLVYYITEDPAQPPAPADAADYAAWYAQTVGEGETERDVPYQALTAENAALLG